jgi:hypothetical protein
VNIFLEDLLARRGKPIPGNIGHTLGVGLHGGETIPKLPYEPDPATFRNQYYYNTTLNVLYLKVIVQEDPQIGLISAYWKKVSLNSK